MDVGILWCLLAGLARAAEEPGQLAVRTTDAYLPLTTTFTPPADCFTDVSLMSGYGYPTSYSVGLGPGNEFSACSPCWLALASTSTCYPSGWSSAAVFSPGICPSGYSIACSSVNVIGSLSETVATCCPSGYLCAPEVRIAAFPWYSAQPCSSYPDSDLSIQALSVGSTATITAEFPPTMAPGFAILANSVQVRWQETEILFGTTTSSTTAAASSSTSAAASGPDTAGTSSGLSTGAKAGIGVAVAVGCLGIIIGATSWLCLYRRRSRRNPPAVPAGNAMAPGPVASQRYVLKAELDGTAAAPAADGYDQYRFGTPQTFGSMAPIRPELGGATVTSAISELGSPATEYGGTTLSPGASEMGTSPFPAHHAG